MAIRLARGDKRTITLTFTHNDVAIDLTDKTVFFTAKLAPDNPGGADPDAAAIIKRTITSHSDPTNGETSFITTEVETATADTYYFDIQLKTAAGVEIISIPPQVLVIYEDITRRTT